MSTVAMTTADPAMPVLSLWLSLSDADAAAVDCSASAGDCRLEAPDGAHIGGPVPDGHH